MESFVFKEVNKSSREKDKSKIKFYGAFASALGYVIHAANAKRKVKLANKFTVYRGTKLNQQEISERYSGEKPINLLGFTSSTLNRSRALSFSVDASTVLADDPEKIPVLVIIEFTGRSQYFYLDSKEVSAYPIEKEVLLQDGIEYKFMGMTTQNEVIVHGGIECTKLVTVVKLRNKQDDYSRSCFCWRVTKLLLN